MESILLQLIAIAFASNSFTSLALITFQKHPSWLFCDFHPILFKSADFKKQLLFKTIKTYVHPGEKLQFIIPSIHNPSHLLYRFAKFQFFTCVTDLHLLFNTNNKWSINMFVKSGEGVKMKHGDIMRGSFVIVFVYSIQPVFL